MFSLALSGGFGPTQVGRRAQLPVEAGAAHILIRSHEEAGVEPAVVVMEACSGLRSVLLPATDPHPAQGRETPLGLA